VPRIFIWGDISSSCSCKAQDSYPLGDHGFPLGNNQGLCPCMQGLRP